MSHFFFKKEPNLGRWGNHCPAGGAEGGGRVGAGSEADSQGTEFIIGPFTPEGWGQGPVC